MQFLASVLPPDTDPAFFKHLRALDCSGVTVQALPEGSLAFPGVSVLQAEWVEKVGGPGGLAAQLITRPAGAIAAGVRAPPSGTAPGDASALSGQLC